MIDQSWRPVTLHIRTRRLALRGRRPLIVEKITSATEPMATTVTDTPAVAPNTAALPPKAIVSQSERIIRRIPLAMVEISGVFRDVDAKNVATLMESYREVGQTAATLVREKRGIFRVISGNNRVRAARESGWDQLDAVVLDCDELGLRLIKIADELHRRKHSVLEQAELTAEWTELLRRKGVQSARPSGGQQPKDKGLSKAARALGVTKEVTMRSKRIASLSMEAKAKARELGLHDNQSALLRVSKLTSPELQLAELLKLSQRKKTAPRPANKRRIADDPPQGNESSGSASTSAPPVRQHLPERNLQIPEALDRRDVEKEFIRLNERWIAFRLLLENAPVAARRRFIQDVLMRDSFIKEAADALQPKRASTDEQSRAT